MEKRCTSCKQAVTNDRKATVFPCPICSAEIIRCGKCRQTAILYKCPKGDFEGP